MLESNCMKCAHDELLVADGLKKYFIVKRGFPNPLKQVVRAVDKVSLKIRRGEAFGLVGESGCGKSTVGRALLRLFEPDSGRVLLDGDDIMGYDKAALLKLRKRAQMIFQDPYSSLNPRRSVGKTLAEPMLVHGLKPRRQIPERIKALVAEVGLQPDAIYKYPHEFSGGQRQRIGIARALVFEPELIVADEPVSALDVSIQTQILLLLKSLQDRHKLSFLFISHDLAVVRCFCQRLAVMYLGRIIEQGTVSQIFDAPLHPYTRMLRAASPVPDPDKSLGVMRIAGEVPSPIDPPSGCHFHPRCPECRSECRQVYPQWRDLGGERGLACHLYQS